MKFSRRTAMEILGAVALTPAAEGPLAAAQIPAATKEGKDTPKIAVGMGAGGGLGGGGRSGADAAPGAPAPDPSAGPRRINQLGVDNVLSGGPATRQTAERLTAPHERAQAVEHTGRERLR